MSIAGTARPGADVPREGDMEHVGARTHAIALRTAIAARSAFLPLLYQRRWVEDAARFKIGLWARQTGKSTAIALEVNDKILRAEADGQRILCVLLSRGERQSAELARKVRDIGALVAEGRKALGQTPRLVELAGNVSELRYPGGSRCIALPANPDTARGYSGHVWLDEFAFHADSDAIWTALFPTISRGFDLRVLSTANGQQNRFYALWTEAIGGAAKWSAHKVTIHGAVAQGAPHDIDVLRAGIRDELAWRQEYECEFVDEATAWLPWELIRACEDPRAGIEGLRDSGIERANEPQSLNPSIPQSLSAWYAGWDVARWHDLSVFWLLERVGDVLWTREVLAMRRVAFDEQLSLIGRRIEGRRGFSRLCIDATGIGEMPAEQAARRWGGRVEAVKFSGGVKELMAGDLRKAMEDRKLRVPVDEEIRADLHCVRALRTAAGNVRFEGESAGSHADRFWALALAVHAAGNQGGGGFAFV